MRTAAYCRFSSDQQRDASIRDQLRNIENYCARLNWPAPALYQDQAISGARQDRPGYQAMLDAAEVGAFDVLLVDDLSRLSRDQIETAKTIRQLKFLGIRVVGVSDGIDTARDSYKLETGLRGLMSEFYLDDLAKKTHRGLMGQALDGYSAGGLPYGYKSVHDGKGYKRVIDDEQARWVRFVFERYAAGHRPRAIAGELNRMGVKTGRGGTWAHSAIYPDSKGVGMLANPIYNGRQVWNRTQWVKDPVTGRRRRLMRPSSEWVVIEAPELQIIGDELWAKCQAMAKRIRTSTAGQKQQGKHQGGRVPKYLLSGMLKCGVCGGSYVLRDSVSYACATHKNRGVAACDNHRAVRRATLETRLLAEVKANLLSETAYREFETEVRRLLAAGRPTAEGARKRAVDAQKAIDRIVAAIKDGMYGAAMKTALQSAEGELAEAQAEIAAAERARPADLLPRAREVYEDLVRRLEHTDAVAEAREALRELIGDVVLVPREGNLDAETTSAGLAGTCFESVVAGTRSVCSEAAPLIIRRVA